MKKLFYSIILFLTIFGCSKSNLIKRKLSYSKKKPSGRFIPNAIRKRYPMILEEVKKLAKKREKFKKKINKKDYKLKTAKKTLNFKNLPQSFDGYKIVLFSDIHVMYLDEELIYKVVNTINRLKPDLILFTGDLTNYKHTELTESKMKILKEIGKISKNEEVEVISIFGNHDYGYYDKKKGVTEKFSKEKLNRYKTQMITLHKELGWKLLDNQYYEINKSDEKIYIIGLGELGYCSLIPNDGGIIKALKTNYESSQNKNIKDSKNFKIVMVHDPDAWPFILNTYKDIPLTVSGHTHGSKYTTETNDFKNPENWAIRIAPKKTKKNDQQLTPKPGFCIHSYYSGLYKKNKKNFLYVNNGASFSAESFCKKNKQGQNKCENHILYDRGGIPLEITLLILNKY